MKNLEPLTVFDRSYRIGRLIHSVTVMALYNHFIMPMPEIKGITKKPRTCWSWSSNRKAGLQTHGPAQPNRQKCFGNFSSCRKLR